MANILVSLVIVTADKDNYLACCLDSINTQSFPQYEVIVVDNSVNNIFYCRGLDKGIRQSSGKFVLCLNDDVILDNDFIQEALKGFDIDPRIGMISGKILRMDKETIDTTGLFLTPWRTAKERGYGIEDSGQFEKPGYIFGVNGAVAFYRKEMLEQIKINGEYFDSDYRIFYEDLDIAWRAKNSGWKGYYIPTAIAYHLRGGTVREGRGINKKYARRYLNDELHFDLVKNRYLSIIKNESLLGFLLHLPFILIHDIIMWAYILLFSPRLIKKLFLQPIPAKSAFKKRKIL